MLDSLLESYVGKDEGIDQKIRKQVSPEDRAIKAPGLAWVLTTSVSSQGVVLDLHVGQLPAESAHWAWAPWLCPAENGGHLAFPGSTSPQETALGLQREGIPYTGTHKPL